MELTRRTLLAASGLSFAIAGCVSDEDDTGDDSGEDDTGDDSGTDDGTGENGMDDDSGGDDTGDDSGTDDGTGENGEQEDGTVQVRSHPEFGDILVGPEGMTLYNFDADTQGEPESACQDDCADSWPPLTVENTPTAGENVTADLSTFEREDGRMHVTANGWPLYYFANDEEPGDTEGQGVNDVWWVLQPDGTPIRPDDEDDDNGVTYGY